jgi:hypothetical protein
MSVSINVENEQKAQLLPKSLQTQQSQADPLVLKEDEIKSLLKVRKEIYIMWHY